MVAKWPMGPERNKRVDHEEHKTTKMASVCSQERWEYKPLCFETTGAGVPALVSLYTAVLSSGASGKDSAP